MDNLNF